MVQEEQYLYSKNITILQNVKNAIPIYVSTTTNPLKGGSAITSLNDISENVYMGMGKFTWYKF